MSPDHPQRRSNHTRPSQTTFWVRRIVALLVLAILISLVVLIVRFAWSWMQAADDSQQRAKVQQNKEQLVTQPVACKMTNIAYKLEPEKAENQVGTGVNFKVALRNTKGNQPCTMNGAIDKVGVKVVTGEDTVWESWKCQEKVDPQPLLLGTGMEYNTTITWDGKNVSKCKAGDIAQAGTYQAIPVLNGKEITEGKEVFTLK
ncbi:hypothetical protein [Varibaculum vaginae]|uniref:hypothetical protein n=1 Tax=Varibaculum vaginae TaxID=2364797 RepID=UPI000F08ED3E|nr:hypothetical protein [Varibaculum vaginae]